VAIIDSEVSGEKGRKGEKRGEKGRKGEKRGEKGRKGEKRDPYQLNTASVNTSPPSFSTALRVDAGTCST
jgi:hypothetical protein